MKANLLRGLTAAALFLLSVQAVWAQNVPKLSNNLSGTIAVTNTFQQVQGQTNNRQGCAIQNGATQASGDQMWVYFGACANATKAASVVLQPGQSVNCLVGGNIVVQDPICITGTSNDAFFANFQ